MKLRSGFVSNSSSSSFIVTANADTPLKFPVTIEVDFTNMVTEVIVTEEEVESYIHERFSYSYRNCNFNWKDYKPAIELYEQMKEEISAGNIIRILDVDRCSEEHAMLLRNKFSDQGMEVLYSDED